jgi:hypothetical protein
MALGKTLTDRATTDAPSDAALKPRQAHLQRTLPNSAYHHSHAAAPPASNAAGTRQPTVVRLYTRL